MVNPFHLGTAARRWVPALATALAVAGAVPTGAAATSISGTIVVIEDAMPDDPQDFRFNVAGSEFVLDDDAATSVPSPTPNQSTISDVAPGYQALAQDPVEGWDLTNVSCQDPDGGTFTTQTGATVDVDPGETITCTVTNSRRGNVVVHLDAQPDDPAPVDFVADWGSFTLNDDGGDADAMWPDMTVEGLLPGTYALTEHVPAGLTLKSVSCNDPDSGTTTASATVSLDVDPGETIECTFTNVPAAVTPTCNGKAATIVGTAGATVRGSQGPDVIVALSGDVRIDGRGGNDTICTGSGTDIVNGGAGDDWIDAGDGTNTVDGGAGSDVIRAGSGNDTLLGDGGNDRVDGGDGNNLVSTGSGNDQIVTGSGDDRIDGGKDYDTCQPGGGQNSVNRCEG